MFMTRVILTISLWLLAGRLRNIGLYSLFLWATGAPVLFLGQFDVITYFLSAVSLLLLIIWKKKPSPPILFFLGFLSGISVLLSAGTGLFIVFISSVLLIQSFPNRRNTARLLLYLAGGGAVILVCFFFNMNIVSVIFKCLSNNTAFNTQAGRSAWWMIANWLDYLLFAGPMCLLTIIYFSVKLHLNKSRWKKFPYQAAPVFTLLLITAHFFARGETGRLMLFMLPVPLLLSGYIIQSTSEATHCRLMILLQICLIVSMRMLLKTVFIF